MTEINGLKSNNISIAFIVQWAHFVGSSTVD